MTRADRYRTITARMDLCVLSESEKETLTLTLTHSRKIGGWGGVGHLELRALFLAVEDP